jgi:uncharacterized protein YjbJ (UPF0337 family)
VKLSVWIDCFGLSKTQLQESRMDKDRMAGSAKQVGGAIKEGFGKATGDARLKSDGSAEKTGGKIQNAIGGVKDTRARRLGRLITSNDFPVSPPS